MSTSLEQLSAEYESLAPRYESLCHELATQLKELLDRDSVTLAVPLESRVKTWQSIRDKCEQNALEPEKLADLRDISGLRIVVLFKRDIDKVREIISQNFEVLREEDTQERLAEDQFGYGSVHFEVTPKKEWLAVPTLSNLKGLVAEIQLRTASQHIWAASSHVLQYKKQSHVPVPVRRAINRVAALLETVDLEFERVLAERDEYVQDVSQAAGELPLDIDTLRAALDRLLPAENKFVDDEYADLLDELLYFDIKTVAQTEQLVETHRQAVMRADAAQVEIFLAEPKVFEGLDLLGRAKRGAYYTHAGLVRKAMALEFGEKFEAYRTARQQRS